MGSLAAACQWLQETQIGLLVRESLWGFQIVVATHIMGLVFSVGLLLWFDLRLLGLGFGGTRVSAVYRRLMPWTAAGFAVMLVSGAMLFVAYASSAVTNVYFQAKLSLIALAGANALFYHMVTERGIDAWDHHPRPPVAARLAGLASILLWATVIFCGRMISYTMF